MQYIVPVKLIAITLFQSSSLMSTKCGNLLWKTQNWLRREESQIGQSLCPSPGLAGVYILWIQVKFYFTFSPWCSSGKLSPPSFPFHEPGGFRTGVKHSCDHHQNSQVPQRGWRNILAHLTPNSHQIHSTPRTLGSQYLAPSAVGPLLFSATQRWPIWRGEYCNSAGSAKMAAQG